MTEAEWLACEDPQPMLRSVRGRISNRKLRLLIAGCCRLRWYAPGGQDVEKIVTSVESFADGEITFAEYLTLHLSTHALSLRIQVAVSLGIAAKHVLWDDSRLPSQVWNEQLRAVAPKVWEVGEYAEEKTTEGLHRLAEAAGYGCAPTDDRDARNTEEFRGVVALETAIQARLLRDIFGNPFRPVTFSPAWRTDTAIALARQMYEARDFSAMPILADALQDAGCDNDDVLNHCRSEGPHVRGCWVVDLVLEKE